MTTTSTGTALVPVAGRFVFADAERLVLVGFLAGYRGATREAYRMVLRLFAAWCAQHDTALFEVRRVDIESYARQLEARAGPVRRWLAGCARWRGSTATPNKKASLADRRRCMCGDRGWTTSPTPSVWPATSSARCSSPRGLAGPREHALISLLALNGLRISEALGIDIDDLSVERGHRTVTGVRKGGKVVTMPLAPRVARALDLAIGDRAGGPVFLAVSRRRMDRHAASRIVGRVARAAGLDKHISPHTLRHAFITAALDAGVPLRDVQEAASHADPRTTMRYDRGRQSLDRHATYIVATFVAGANR